MATQLIESLSIDGDRLWSDISELAELTDSSKPGWSRQVFSETYHASREWTASRMRMAGLETHFDGAGNIIGRLPGTSPSAPPIVTGSHTDTVHAGGRFDGILGVLGAIEAVRALRSAEVSLTSDVIVVDFMGEEANDFGMSCLGSSAIAGILNKEDLDRMNDSGQTLADAFSSVSLDPHSLFSASWSTRTIKGYIELHIEQGPILEQEGIEIGVVTSIAGIERFVASFLGRADHAGTTPMDARSDALLAAAEATLTIERIGCGAPTHGVATTGRISNGSGSLNVVPNSAQIWAEIRSIDAPWLTTAKRQLIDEIREGASARGVEVTLNNKTDNNPVPTTQSMQDLIGFTAAESGYSWRAIPSGAGHDAAHMATLGPMGMIFVPSHKGRSHCPEEWTDQKHLEAGVRTLAASLVRIDASGS